MAESGQRAALAKHSYGYAREVKSNYDSARVLQKLPFTPKQALVHQKQTVVQAI